MYYKIGFFSFEKQGENTPEHCGKYYAALIKKGR
jgi:hypothetical protein